MDKILFLKEADRMAASGTNAGTREYVYKKAALVTGTKPKRDEAGFIAPYAMFRPKAESQNEHELYEFMLEEKEKKSQQKWEALEKLIRAVLAIPHANAKAAVVGFYLDGKALKEIRDSRGRTLGVNRARHFKKLGLELLALELRKVPEKS